METVMVSEKTGAMTAPELDTAVNSILYSPAIRESPREGTGESKQKIQISVSMWKMICKSKDEYRPQSKLTEYADFRLDELRIACADRNALEGCLSLVGGEEVGADEGRA